MNAVEKLKNAENEAYSLYPKSCSHAVWHVIKQYVPDQPYNVANALLLQLQCDARWKQAGIAELEKLANEGTLIVGGLAEAWHGHVIVVYPEPAKPAGGFVIKKDGKTLLTQRKGNFALAMSTSLGTWPGAMSKGDKTIRDPWGRDDIFSRSNFGDSIQRQKRNQWAVEGRMPECYN